MSHLQKKKRHSFDTFSARIFATLLLGVLGAAALTWWLAFGERQHVISHERNSYRSERIKHSEQLIRAIDALPAANREALLHGMPRLGLQVMAMPENIKVHAPISPYAIALTERLGSSFKITPLPPEADNCLGRPDAEHPIQEMCEALIIQLHDGSTVRQTIFPMRSPTPPIQTETIYYLFLFLVCIAFLAFLVARMSTRPLQQLAQAATDLGQDINRAPLPERGAQEILQATRAFNAMQSRIRSNIQQRTQMLAAITHDLQTPLTRLRLRLEKVGDDELRDKLIGDLSSMQMMVKEGLELARSMDSNEELKALDIDSLLDSLCSDAVDGGHQVSFDGKSGITVMARPMALRRCINNLIDNALKYGKQAHISIEPSQINRQDHVDIIVRDHGPGIPEDQLTRVFEPFYRLETSRSRETGGTGLGLSIARNIAQQHQAELSLKNIEGGGLEVRLRIPIKSI